MSIATAQKPSDPGQKHFRSKWPALVIAGVLLILALATLISVTGDDAPSNTSADCAGLDAAALNSTAHSYTTTAAQQSSSVCRDSAMAQFLVDADDYYRLGIREISPTSVDIISVNGEGIKTAGGQTAPFIKWVESRDITAVQDNGTGSPYLRLTLQD